MLSKPISGIDKAFYNAFALYKPIATLLELARIYPTEEGVRALVVAYMDAARKSPHKIQEFANYLVQIIKSPDAPTISFVDTRQVPRKSSLSEALSRILVELHSRHLAEPITKTIKPSNRYLTSCLLSAASLRCHLTPLPSPIWAIMDIIDLKENVYIPEQVHQVVIVGACLHLLTSGMEMYGRDGCRPVDEKDRVIRALNRLHQTDFSRPSNAEKLVKKSVEHAQSGFMFNLELKDAWFAVFPDVRGAQYYD